MPAVASLEAICKTLCEHMPELRDRYAILSLAVFGSYARAEHRSGSDGDILVEFAADAKVGFFEFLTLQERLAEIVRHRVDLVSKAALKPHIGDRILDELVPV